MKELRVLAVSCHPCTLELVCGGTLAKYSSLGHKVFMAHVANGDKGHISIMPDELAKIRHDEAEKSAKMIGAECFDLGTPDLEVYDSDKKLFNKVIDLFREVKPDVILTHDPKDYAPDLQSVSKLVFGADYAASIYHYFTEINDIADVAPIYYMDTFAGIRFDPTEYVDISEQINTKLDMLRCHDSQLTWLIDHKDLDFVDFSNTMAKFRGIQCGVAYAEAFRRCMAWPRITPYHLLP